MATQKSPSRSPTSPETSKEIPNTIDPNTPPEDEIVVHQATTTIEVGDDVDEFDDGYATGSESAASTSLTSGVRDYTFERGRRYHKFREGQYHFPNDDEEQNREDMKHAMVVKVCGGRLHFAPIGDNPQNIIDLGTGTGIWAIDMGDEYASATILGVDLSPIQPEWVPPNVKFMVDDAESPWLHPENHFDYVHSRHCAQAFKDFPTLLSRAYKHIKPGGWIELQGLDHWAYCDDNSLKSDYALAKWLDLLIEALAVLGLDLNGARKHAELMRNAGFINVEERVFKVPIGLWPKNQTMKLIGLYMRTVLYDGLQAISLGPFTRGLKWQSEEVEVLLADVRKSLMDSSQHTYFTANMIYGQKPLEAAVE